MLKFDNIRLQIPTGQPVVFWLKNNMSDSNYVLKSVSGLESVPSDTSLLTARGARTFRSREVVFRFTLKPTLVDADHQNAQLRDNIQRLYGATAIMTTLSLRLGATGVVYTKVALKDLEVDLNAPDPEYVLTMETGLLMPNFTSYAAGPYAATTGTTYGLASADNPGQVASGFIFQAVLSAIPSTPTSLSIVVSYISPPDFPLDTGPGIISLVGAPAFAVGDVIIYDTVSNALYRVRGSVILNLLPYLAVAQGKVFYTLVPGQNTTISLTTKSSVTLSYTPEYVGV